MATYKKGDVYNIPTKEEWDALDKAFKEKVKQFDEEHWNHLPMWLRRMYDFVTQMGIAFADENVDGYMKASDALVRELNQLRKKFQEHYEAEHEVTQ